MFYGELPFGKRYGSVVKSFCYCYCSSVCVRPWLLFGWTTKWDTSHASPRGWCFILVSNLAMREHLSASVLNAERQKRGFSNDFRKCSLCLHQVNKRWVERTNLLPSCRAATLSLSLRALRALMFICPTSFFKPHHGLKTRIPKETKPRTNQQSKLTQARTNPAWKLWKMEHCP